MSGPDLRLLAPAAAVWVVTACALSLPPGWVVGAAAGCGLSAVVLHRLGRTWLVVGVLVCAAAAGVATAVRVHALTTGVLAEAARLQAAVTVQGVLLDDPRRVPPKPSSGALVVRDLFVARVRVERLAVAGRQLRLRSPVLVLSADPHWLGLLPSQRVRVEGLLRPAARGDDVAALLSGRGPPRLSGGPSAVERIAASVRAGLRRAVTPLPAAERGLLPGLVVGDVSGLPDDLQADFRTVGLTHLVAVSGTNVAVVLSAVLFLCGWLGLPLRLRPPVAMLALLGFVVLVRPSPSVLRAAVMGGVGLVALRTGRGRSTLPVLCGAVIGLLLVAPDLAVSPGFALSVLATGGLVVLAPGWRDRWSAWLPRGLAEALAIPAAAQVACGPVVVAISGQLGLLSVPANLLAVPAVAPATVLGLAAALAAPLSGQLATAFAWLAWLPTAWLVRVARTGAALPGATLPWRSGGTGAALLVGLTLVGAVVLRSAALRRLCAAGCAGVLLTVATLWLVAPGWPPPGWFLVACDVGQGDGLVLDAGRQSAVVIDTGPDPRRIDDCLRRLGVRRVPLVVLTHLHADHVEGLPGVLRGRRVGLVEVGPLDEPVVERARVLRWTADARVPVVRAAVGEERSAGGARWQVLAPDHAHHGTTSDPNNSSLVLRLTSAAGHTVLLTGDVEKEAQQVLLDLGVPLQAEVLKVPHHGSSHQLPAFLAAVHPEVTLTSVGAGNPFGHPSPATIGQLVSAGARSYRTDHDGDVALVERHGTLLSAARSGAGETARPRAADRLERIPGTTLTTLASRLSRLPTNWCGSSSSPLARGPPRGTMGRCRLPASTP